MENNSSRIILEIIFTLQLGKKSWCLFHSASRVAWCLVFIIPFENQKQQQREKILSKILCKIYNSDCSRENQIIVWCEDVYRGRFHRVKFIALFGGLELIAKNHLFVMCGWHFFFPFPIAAVWLGLACNISIFLSRDCNS